jgi:hypothetical protein
MADSHPDMFRPSTIDDGEILKLVNDHLLPPRAILQWRLTKDEDIPTPNTNEIVVSIFLSTWLRTPVLLFPSRPPSPLQNRANPFESCDRTTSEMRGLSPQDQSGDSQ